MSSILLLCALLSSAAALNIGLGLPSPSPAAPPPLRLADAFRAPFAGGPAPPRPSIGAMRDAAVRGAMASSLALALSTANPAFTAADVPAPSAAVERAGFSLVADSDQEKFLAERAKMKTQASSAAPSPVAAGRPGDRSLHPRAHARQLGRDRHRSHTHKTQAAAGLRENLVAPLRRRRLPRSQYEQDLEGTYMTAEQTTAKKATYTQALASRALARAPRLSSPTALPPPTYPQVVYGLIAIAFVARAPVAALPPPLPPSHIHPRRARSRPSPRRHR